MHRLIFPPFGDNFPFIFSYYNTRSGEKTCHNCNIKRDRLAHILRQVKRFYRDLCRNTDEGARPFTLWEIITLYCLINLKLRRLWRVCQVVQSYIDNPGDVGAICANCTLKRRTYFYYIATYIKRPYLNFCRQRK